MTRCKDYGSDFCWYKCVITEWGCAKRHLKGKKRIKTMKIPEQTETNL